MQGGINVKSPKLKAQELKLKHGNSALIQAQQVLYLLGWEKTRKRDYWEEVVKHLT